MLQLKNKTPFEAVISLLPNEAGIDTLYTTTKATFAFGKQWSLADQQLTPQAADEYWTEPESSSLKIGTDIHLGKMGTDVVIIGEACARDYKAVKQLEVGISAGRLKKHLIVFGDRVWDAGRISNPATFTAMPVMYENAFGGEWRNNDGDILTYAPNPVGKGFGATNSHADDNNPIPLPNIEDPACLITEANDKPLPTGTGFIAPFWQGRNQYAGTYDAQWEQQRAPYLPTDFDKRFFNAATTGLIADHFFQGGEPVVISNMHPSGELRFNLPVVKLKATISMAQKVVEIDNKLETVIINPSDNQLSLVWKAAFPCDKNALKIDSVNLTLLR